MPLVRIELKRGTTAPYRQAIAEGIYQAMRETFNVPDGDRFMLINEHDGESYLFDNHYLGIERSADLVIIQITANNTRTVPQKQALYRRIAERLAENPGIRPQDVFINLVEVVKENWSFGNGIAQYA